MAFKLFVLCAALALANARHLTAPLRYSPGLGYSARYAHAAPVAFSAGYAHASPRAYFAGYAHSAPIAYSARYTNVAPAAYSVRHYAVPIVAKTIAPVTSSYSHSTLTKSNVPVVNYATAPIIARIATPLAYSAGYFHVAPVAYSTGYDYRAPITTASAEYAHTAPVTYSAGHYAAPIATPFIGYSGNYRW